MFAVVALFMFLFCIDVIEDISLYFSRIFVPSYRLHCVNSEGLFLSASGNITGHKKWVFLKQSHRLCGGRI